MLFIILVIVIVVALLIFLDYKIASEFRDIAEEKGYDYINKYFWYTFFLGIIGMLMVIALPDKNTRVNGNYTGELPEL